MNNYWNNVDKITLDNGLTILLKEIHTAPLISQWVWYRVGSRNEQAGKTGISHFLEHLQFKGTPKYPHQFLDHAISRDGGIWNAMTYLDWTTYFETMPADKIDLSLELEVDRMVNNQFKPEEIESERTVILSEREGNENEPTFRLSEAVQKAAFPGHPYQHEVIGESEDIRTISRDDLIQHYRENYHPGNAVLALAGDFNVAEMQSKLKQLYENVTAGAYQPQAIHRDEPPEKETRIVVEGPGETTFLDISYRAPCAIEEDFFTLTVLDSILSGPSSLNMFGGGSISNKTSRLYQQLVEKDLAVSISGGVTATIDPYLFGISATIHPAHTPEESIRVIDEQIRRLQEEKVKMEEIQRAVKQARALFSYGSENITNQAFWMGYANMFADYDWFINYIQQLEQVSAEELQRVAQIYLQPSRRVVGIYQPTSAGRQ